jgi:8-oxo-dGTP pyrophosphatase MutT (NUDIX family)
MHELLSESDRLHLATDVHLHIDPLDALGTMPRQLMREREKQLVRIDADPSLANGELLLALMRDPLIAGTRLHLDCVSGDFALVCALQELRDDLESPWRELVSVGAHMLLSIDARPLWQVRSARLDRSPGRATSTAAGYLSAHDPTWRHALVRELREELGMRIDCDQLRALGLYLQHDGAGEIVGWNVLAAGDTPEGTAEPDAEEVAELWLGDQRLWPSRRAIAGAFESACHQAPPLAALVAAGALT